MNGSDIFQWLIGLNLDYDSFDWLENRGLSDFEILISVVLTQNTNWNNVAKTLENLRANNINTLEQILNAANLEGLIQQSGFYNVKAKRLRALAGAILDSFNDIESFKSDVSREWLLEIKGIGFESADSILNYMCKREILVVDSYTHRLALHLGYDIDSYEDLQIFFQSGVEESILELRKALNSECELYELYQIFHAMIVAFAKKCFKGKELNSIGIEAISRIRF